jgi:RHS repeat-associated protein
MVKTRTARGGVTRFQYDVESNLLEVYTPIETVQRMRYDAEGNLLESQDATRHVKLGYGHKHRVVWRDEAGTRLGFEYDKEDRLTAVVNEAGERYTFELNALGDVQAEVGFDGQRRWYLRDALGRVTQAGHPNDTTSDTAYDRGGRIAEIKHGDGTFARFGYDAVGMLARAENESSVVEIERDALGRVVLERINGQEVQSGYGATGDRTRMRTSLGAEVGITRDAVGDAVALYTATREGWRPAPDVTFARDGMGLERSRAFGNGIEVQWDRDVAGRPLARRTVRGGTVARPLDSRAYRWRGDDQIEGILDNLTGPRWFDHDARGRLVRERRADRTVDRAMDAVGNVYRSPDGRDRRYGRGGRLEAAGGATYEHDATGNVVAKVEADGAKWAYAWNGHGMLREVTRPDGTRVAFEYDPFARRTTKKLLGAGGEVMRETRFVWDGNYVVHEVDSDTGVTTWHWEPESYAPVMKEHDGRKWSVVSDHLGTPTEMYDEVGTLAWKMQLDVFGVAECEEGRKEDCHWRWPGQYEDGETGLLSTRYRYYDPATAAFVSQDRIFSALLSQRYAYPANPLTDVDPLGLISTDPGVYDVMHESYLPIPMRHSTDKVQFREANRQLYHAMENDPGLKASLMQRYPGVFEHVSPGIRGGRSTRAPAGLLWHHHPTVGGLLQLVDKAEHETRWPDFHPDAFGGRKTWGGGESCR